MEGVIAANLAAVRSRIEAAARAAGRAADNVTLVAVSKTHPAASVRDALAAGHRVFGENRVQEAEAKYPALREAFPGLALHLIGPLQTNKVRDAVALCDMIETVDRPRLAQALAKEMERTGRRPPCLIEVNTGEEPQKSGVLPTAADDFIVECRDRLGLPIEGLMCVPPLDEEPALHFALLREIARRTGINVSTISRILATLVSGGLVEHVTATGRYRLGMGVIRLANAAGERLDVRSLARPHLEDLASQVQETITLSVPGGHEAITLDFVQSPLSVRSVAQVGRASAAHATASSTGLRSERAMFSISASSSASASSRGRTSAGIASRPAI